MKAGVRGVSTGSWRRKLKKAILCYAAGSWHNSLVEGAVHHIQLLLARQAVEVHGCRGRKLW